MYKLKIVVSEAANYIYHMLSVARVGYDNDYGRKYAGGHDPVELAVLKTYEEYLTVSGGEQCGQLYTLLVAKPACASSLESLETYLLSLVDLFTYKDAHKTSLKYPELESSREFLDEQLASYPQAFSFCLDAFEKMSEVIIPLAQVLMKNIALYQSVWGKEGPKLMTYKEALEGRFAKDSHLVRRWEEALKDDLRLEAFEVVLVTSIEDGAQAIDISPEKDVFNINDDLDRLVGFISHEIGIYIIFQTLPMVMKEQMQRYWLCIESLATYHNHRVLYEDESLFSLDNVYFERFDALYAQNEPLTFVEIIERAAIA